MHRISIYCIKVNYLFYATYQKFDIYELFATQRKRHPVWSASHKYIIRSFVNGGADVKLARSRPAYTARSPKAWRRFKHYVVGFVGKPTDRMAQTASSCTHVLHKPLTGLRKLEVTSMKVQV